MAGFFTFSDLIEATGGSAVRGELHSPVPGISTDTRNLAAGEWFLALRGERFEGHDYLAAALERGAGGLIVSEPSLPEAILRKPEIAILRVEDTLKAYGDIAHAWRRRINPQVVCIAGSTGKTTTKEMIAAGLAERSDVLVSQGNFNNLVGLPKTLLGLNEERRLALTEIGMNTWGELKRLTEIADPDLAVLTNIGNAHVGRFGSVENLMLAKAELLTAMRPGAQLIANADCPRSAEVIERFGSHTQVTLFGMSGQAPYRAEAIGPLRPWGYSFDFVHPHGRLRARLPVYGRHNVANALCAMTVLCELGIGAEQAAEAVGRFQAPPMRSRAFEQGGVVVIEDCYNASPAAVQMALNSLADVECLGRRHAVLGDMLELGETEEQFHREVGRTAGRLPKAVVYGVGERAKWIVEEARLAGCSGAQWFSAREEAAKALAAAVAPGDVVLIKASRLLAFEEIASVLRHKLQ